MSILVGANDQKDNDPSATGLLSIGSCGTKRLHGACNTGHKNIDLQLVEFCKNCFSVIKKSPARRAGYLQANDLYELYE